MANNNQSTATVSGGVGLPTILGVVFIVLKLTGVIGWSWVWVLSPFWIPVAFGIVVLFILFVVMIVKDSSK